MKITVLIVVKYILVVFVTKEIKMKPVCKICKKEWIEVKTHAWYEHGDHSGIYYRSDCNCSFKWEGNPSDITEG